MSDTFLHDLPSYTLKELHQVKELTETLLRYHETNLNKIPNTEDHRLEIVSIELSLKYGYQDLEAIEEQIRLKSTKNEPSKAPKEQAPSTDAADTPALCLTDAKAPEHIGTPPGHPSATEAPGS
jgi:hypothetical protein